MGFYSELLPCTYSIIKGMVATIFPKWQESLVSPTALILTTVSLVVGFLLLFPWFIFHFMVKTYLALRQSDKFGGLLFMNTLMEHTKMTFTVVYILEHQGSNEQLLTTVKTSCQNLMKSHYKFTSTVRKCCGYYYFLKDQVSIDDVVSIIEEKCTTKGDVLDYLRKNCFHPLDSSVKLWSVKAFKNPIVWNGDNKTSYYPVVITYNHCLADGICLFVFQQKHLLGNVVKNKFESILSKTKLSKGNLMKSNVLQLAHMALEKNLTLLSNPDNPDQNLALFIEKKPKHIQQIRELNKRFQCTFTDILSIASVIVLTDYLKEKNIFPRKIMVANTCRRFADNTWAILNGRIFDNEMSLDLYALPDVRSNSVLEKFIELKETLRIQRNRSTSQLMYLGVRIMSYLPAEVLMRLWRLVGERCLLCITNVPGIEFATFGDAAVKDCFGFVNRCTDMKFIMAVHTYDGRLQVSLISEKFLITSKEDLQEVLNKVFKVIDDLYAHCETL